MTEHEETGKEKQKDTQKAKAKVRIIDIRKKAHMDKVKNIKFTPHKKGLKEFTGSNN